MAEEGRPRSRESVENEIAIKAFQDPAFMEALRADPKAVMAKEYGSTLPDKVVVELVEESPTKLYLRLPPSPYDLELSDEQLQVVVGGLMLTQEQIDQINYQVNQHLSFIPQRITWGF
jgi:hypothetical protein